MRKMFFLINVEKDTEGYYAYVPALKGIHVGGDTEEEAEINAKEAIYLYMSSILERGDPLPTGFGVSTDPVETDRIRPLHITAPFTQRDFQGEDAPSYNASQQKDLI